MNFSRTKIIVFFLGIASLLWFLYPRGLFRALLHEDTQSLNRAEEYYLHYLDKHPGNKNATLRLTRLYETLGTPEKATPFLTALVAKRRTDIKVAEIYLDHFTRIGDEEGLYHARQFVAEGLLNAKNPDIKRIRMLWEDALQQALWNRKFDDAYVILDRLMSLGEDSQLNSDYAWAVDHLDRFLGRKEKIIKKLLSSIEADPEQPEPYEELAEVYRVSSMNFEAIELLQNARDKFPGRLSFREALADLLEKSGRLHEAFNEWEDILALPNIEPEKYRLFRMNYAYLLLDNGQVTKSLGIFREILKEDPAKSLNWLNLFTALEKNSDWKNLAVELETYLRNFPDDTDRRKYFIDILLYQLKDASRLSLYSEYSIKHRDPDFALDVGNLLIEKKMHSQAEIWMRRGLTLFPGDRRFLENVLFLMERRKAFAEALDFLEKHLQRFSSAQLLHLERARLLVLNGRDKLAAEAYATIAENSSDRNILHLAARELFFIGFSGKALSILDRVVKRGIDDGETWFWKSECHAYQGEDELAIKAAQKSEGLFLHNQGGGGEEPLRQKLKSAARAHYDAGTLAAYRKLLQRTGVSPDFQADLIDIQFEKKKFREAVREVASFSKNHPEQKQRIRAMNLRLAFHRGDWREAVSLLQEILVENPLHAGYRRDLAESLIMVGRWKEGLQQYDSLMVSSDQEGVRDPVLERRRRDFHDEHDPQVGIGFKMVNLGAEESYTIESQFRYPVRDRFKIMAKGKWAQQNSPSRAFDGSSYGFELGAGYDFTSRLKLEAGGRFGASALRKKFSPWLQAEIMPVADWRLRINAAFHEFRDDVPQAVAVGDLTDRLAVAFEKTFFEKWIWTGKYEFTRNEIRSGSDAKGHLAESGLAYRLLNDPYLTIGYQFSLLDHQGDAAFFAAFPLIQRAERHYLQIYAAKEFRHNAKVQGYLFAGEDSARNLHLFEGDLFGGGFKALWRAHKNINVDASYDFGRESLTGVSGTSHQIGMTLTGHWF